MLIIVAMWSPCIMVDDDDYHYRNHFRPFSLSVSVSLSLYLYLSCLDLISHQSGGLPGCRCCFNSPSSSAPPFCLFQSPLILPPVRAPSFKPAFAARCCL